MKKTANKSRTIEKKPKYMKSDEDKQVEHYLKEREWTDKIAHHALGLLDPITGGEKR